MLWSCYRWSWILCLIALVCFSSAVWAWTPDEEDTPDFPVKNDAVQISVQRENSGHLDLQIRIQSPTIDTVFWYGNSWTRITIPGEAKSEKVGKPQLPRIARAVRLPDRGRIDIKVTYYDYKEYKTGTVIPKQEPVIYDAAGNRQPSSFQQNLPIYQMDEWFPSKIVEFGEAAIIRDARIAPISINPVQYNPVTQMLRIYSRIELDITPITGTGDNEITQRFGSVPSFAGFYSQILGADDLVEEATHAYPGKMIIFARSDASVLNSLQTFIDWKTSSGQTVQLVTYASYTTVTNSMIITALQNAYAAANPPLEYALIVGDEGPTGAYNLPAANGSRDEASDHSFSRLAGNDILGDITVGRFSISSIVELQTMTNRALNYEAHPDLSDTTWFTKAWGYAGTIPSTYSNVPTIRYGLEQVYAAGVRNIAFDIHGSYVDRNLISTRLTPGALYWLHRPGWLGQIAPADISGLNNVNRCFFSMNLTCSSGGWGIGNTGMHEALTRLGTPTTPKGAIAAVATATAQTHVNFNNVMASGIWYGFGTLKMRTPGTMVWSGKFQLWRNYNLTHPTSVTDFSNWNNLMGDPSTPLWCGVPQTVSTNLPASIALARNFLPVTVTSTGSVEGLLVTAWKRNSTGTNETLISRYTDDSGNVLLPLTNASTGSLFVTVTGNPDNRVVPFIDTISVTNVITPDLQLSRYIIDDDTVAGSIGNNDHTANPGEVLSLQLEFKNLGGARFIGGLCAIGVDDNRIQLLDSSVTIPAIVSGDSSLTAIGMRIRLGGGFEDQTFMPITLNITSTDSLANRQLRLFLPIRSIQMRYISITQSRIGGGVDSLRPGGTINLAVTSRNIGGVSAPPATVTISSFNTHVTTPIASSQFPALVLNQNITNSAGQLFQVHADSTILPGTVVTMQLRFASSELSDTLQFPLTVGTRTDHLPSGPDAYGYVAFDQSDTTYNLAPRFAWHEIAVPANRLAITDSGSENSDMSIAYPLPFPVQYYGNRFDSVTICSNGWLSFGVERRTYSQTSGSYSSILYNNFRNWHLPANEGPRNIVCPFWDDLKLVGNDGVFAAYDSLGHCFTVTWRAHLNTGDSLQLEFQAIIYDETYRSTPTDDAVLLLQYRNFLNSSSNYIESYGTIGIADNSYTRALEYSFANLYTPGSSRIPDGNNVNRAILFTTTESPSTVNEEDLHPASLSLIKCYPNPFNPIVTIRFQLPNSGVTQVVVYNAIGRSVTELINQDLSAGEHELQWDGSRSASGVYFITIHANKFVATRKAVLLK